MEERSPAKKVMKAICPKCLQESDVVQVEGLLKCGHCGEWFPAPIATASAPVAPVVESPVPPMAAADSVLTSHGLEKTRQKIRRSAQSFVSIAVLFVIFALLCALGGVLDGEATYFYWMLGNFAIASWFYLIAQIIYIRASLEK